MEIEKQVCSLELATRLKELGVHQESVFGWQKVVDNYELRYFESKGYRDVAAYTLAELGEMLPPSVNIMSPKDMQWLTWQNNRYVHTVAHVGTKVDNPALAEHAGTEANARAKMLIYLIENKIFAPT